METETKLPNPLRRHSASVPRLLLHVFVLAYSVYGVWDGMVHGPSSRAVMFAIVGFLALAVLVFSLRQPPPVRLVDGPWIAEAKVLLARGDKVGAIKIVRNATGMGLGEAKTLVDSWE